MGVVYITYDTEHKYPVVLKTFKEHFRQSSDFRRRFATEAHVWIRLGRHPNIVTAISTLDYAGQLFIVLEYVPGSNLSQWIGTKRLNLTRSLHFAAQLTRGMEYAHRRLGLVHRDIKPHNILITEDNTLKITDFGLARALAPDMPRVDSPLESAETPDTQRMPPGFAPSALVGSQPWMAPEQWEGRNIDTRADIYSFGLVVYQMLTGKHPYDGQAGSWKDRHLKAAANPITGRALPREVVDLVRKCLARTPDDRYDNFSGLLDDVSALYRRVTGRDLGSEIHEGDTSVAQLTNWAAGLIDLERYEEAVNYCDRALDLDRSDAMVWTNKAVALGRWGKYDEEMSCYERALSIAPALGLAWSNKGYALRERKEYQAALKCLDKAVKFDPDYPMAWSNRAQVLLDLGELEEAQDCCDRALELYPHLEHAWINRGLSLLYRGRFADALESFLKAIEINDENEAAWYDAGLARFCTGRMKEALMCFGRAMELKPAYLEPVVWTAQTHMALGAWDKAIEFYDYALRLKPGDPQALQWRKTAGDLQREGGRDASISKLKIHMGRVVVELRPNESTERRRSHSQDSKGR